MKPTLLLAALMAALAAPVAAQSSLTSVTVLDAEPTPIFDQIRAESLENE